MAVIESIYVVAATLWILVVVAVGCVGGHYMLKVRARRRRMTGLIDNVRLSVERVVGPYRAVAAGGTVLLQWAVDGLGPGVRTALAAFAARPLGKSEMGSRGPRVHHRT